MKSLRVTTKLCYLIFCVLLSPFLFGCKGENITVIYGLPESSYVSEVKASLENKKPVVVAFTAEWCPHCKQYKPVFFEVKNLFPDNVTFINVDVDSPEGSSISERFQVSGIPTTAFIRKDGSIFKVQVGEIEKEDLTSITEELTRSKKKKRGEPIAPFPIEVKEAKQAQVKEAPSPQELIDNKKQEEEQLGASEKKLPAEEATPQEETQDDTSDQEASDQEVDEDIESDQ